MLGNGLRHLAWALIALGVGVGVGEVGLRAVDFSYYWSLYKRVDPDRGWAPAPGAEGWQRLEGKALVRINEAGVRDRLWPQQKPAGTFRIAVLGDSFAEAVQVPIEQTFWFLLQGELDACDSLQGRQIEVLNFGVSGYSTAQQLLTLRHRVWPYQPDWVLLAFFHGNDVLENSRAFDADPLRPYFVYRDGQLVVDTAFRQSPSYRLRTAWYGRLGFALLDHSRLLQAIDLGTDVLGLWYRQWQQRDEVEAAAPREPGVDTRVYQEPQDSEWRAAWRVTEGILEQMHEEVRAHGAEFFVVTLTTGAQVHPDPRFREQFQRRLGVSDLFYAERRIAALGQHAGFAVLNLAPEMQFFATFSGIWLHGFENSLPGIGHWNAAGHRLAATLIGKAICPSDP
ncbi:MAG: SGNH/GDSL hydrolase family protein [Gammaproteobacteria bacterium]